MNTYLSGYGSSQRHRTEPELMQLEWWNKVHPELRRRILAMIDACPYDLGIGGGWRSAAQQHALHVAQPKMSPDTPWSFHESSDPMGYGLAVDMLNYNPAIDWANEHDTGFGLFDFEATNGEQWHYQPVEIPKSKRQYNPSVHTIKYWTLPPTGNPPAFVCIFPAVPLKLGSTGSAVVTLQTQMSNFGWYTVRIDGQYGPKTVAAVKLFQTELAKAGLYTLKIDGEFGPKSREAACSYYRSHGWTL